MQGKEAHIIKTRQDNKTNRALLLVLFAIIAAISIGRNEHTLISLVKKISSPVKIRYDK
jgi:hypothetical protein